MPLNTAPLSASFRIEVVVSSLLGDNPDAARSLRDILVFPELPEGLTLSKSASYTDETIPGRTEPWKNYSHSEPTRISFTVKLMATGGKADGGDPLFSVGGGLGLVGRFVPQSRAFLGIAGNAISLALNRESLFAQENEVLKATFKEVHQKVALLESLTYAQYDQQGRAFPPPLVRLIYGENFDRTGVLRSVSFIYRGPWEVETYLCMLVEATIEFEESNLSPRGYEQVRFRKEPSSGKVGGTDFKQLAIDTARSTFGI